MNKQNNEITLQMLSQELSEIKSLVKGRKKAMTVEEVAEFTNLSVDTIYRYTSQRKIPFSKPTGGKVWFDRDEIEKWLLGNPVKTMKAIESEASTFVTLKKAS